MRNILLSRGTASDIERQVNKVLRGLGNPEPPLPLEDVRALLSLDRRYYSTTDDSFLRETISKLTVAGAQIMKRPGLLLDAVRKFDLRALYLPDRKRILLDSAQPDAKQRWNEAHEIGHSILPWHEDLMLGDHEQTLTPVCHNQIEAEANYAAGQLLFLQSRFGDAANDTTPGLDAVRALKAAFGNTYTTTFWRFIEDSHKDVPMIGLIGPHPHFPIGSQAEFRHIIESPAYKAMFESLPADRLVQAIRTYCQYRKRGPLGAGEVNVVDKRGEVHVFLFETFSNTYDCLTMGTYQRRYSRVVGL
ncbi:ImmA/IrrE family metallo-endopeptidase [Rhizobium leguminosarum]|uniref:ImmA/IrrE family metallo-endopeptidase n=1 Tax=Rhizobium leguminosarum TaxID=384 RepID=UPI001C98CCA5|nr:ImmA/IrrE family metallo-endopeptidase [Rhizobium leguminosarum]MBY5731510.1 ImmA/IrrE family metallo-endopeptidase [Rhizobium leguminosarum]